MRKFINKKTLAAAILAVALAATAIGTYAWYIVGTPSESNEAQLGILDYEIEGGFDVVDVPFQPGGSWAYEGAIAPTQHNNIEFVTKVTLAKATTTIKNGPTLYPAAGWQAAKDDPANYGKYNPILVATDYWTIPNDPNVGIDYDTGYIGWGGQDADNCFAWYTDDRAGYEDVYYVAIWGNPTYDKVDFINETVDYGVEGVQIALDVNFSSNAGNMYMNSAVAFNQGWTATQQRRGAIEEAFGAGAADAMDPVDEEIIVDVARPYPFRLGGAPKRVTFADILAKTEAMLAE